MSPGLPDSQEQRHVRLTPAMLNSGGDVTFKDKIFSDADDSDASSQVTRGSTRSPAKASGDFGMMCMPSLPEGLPADGGGFFNCCRCKLQTPLSLLFVKGNQKMCRADWNNYASLAARWKKNKTLKTWFDGLDENERIAWYRRQQGNAPGLKRDFEAIGVDERTSAEAFHRLHAVDEMIPWRIFKRRLVGGEGLTPEKAALEFCALVNNPRVASTHARGEWHVPDYQGLQCLRGTDNRTGYLVVRQNDVSDTASMRNAIASGQDAVQAQASANSSDAWSVYKTPPPRDMPTINSSIADQPAMPVVTTPLLAQVVNEVSLVFLSSLFLFSIPSQFRSNFCSRNLTII